MACLFVLVPNAAPKGNAARTAAGLIVTCNSNGGGADQCTVTATGLAAFAGYRLSFTDTCGGMYDSGVSTDSHGSINQQYNMPEDLNCVTAGWTFTLSSTGRRPQIVGTTWVADLN